MYFVIRLFSVTILSKITVHHTVYRLLHLARRHGYEGTTMGWRGVGVVAQPGDRRLGSHDRRGGPCYQGEAA